MITSSLDTTKNILYPEVRRKGNNRSLSIMSLQWDVRWLIAGSIQRWHHQSHDIRRATGIPEPHKMVAISETDSIIYTVVVVEVLLTIRSHFDSYYDIYVHCITHSIKNNSNVWINLTSNNQFCFSFDRERYWVKSDNKDFLRDN